MEKPSATSAGCAPKASVIPILNAWPGHPVTHSGSGSFA